jgi:hypothetical protein
MTLSLAPVALTYDGGATSVQAVPGIFLEITQGLDGVPDVRGVDTVVPGLAGRVTGPRIVDRMSILLEGVVIGADEAEFRTAMLALRALFDPALPPRDLVAVLEDGSTATVAARALNIASKRVDRESAEVSVELEALADWSVVAGP